MATSIQTSAFGSLFNKNVVRSFGSQTSWAIDPALGNDGNAGTAASPLQTMAEFNDRFASLKIAPATVMTLQLVGNVLDEAPMLVGTRFGAGSSLTILGTRTDVATGTVSAVTGLGNAGTFPWQITTTGITWTSQTLGSQVRFSSGQLGFISEVIDANNVVVGAIAAAGTSVVLTAPTIGLTVTVATLSRALPPIVNASGQTLGVAQLSIQDLSFDPSVNNFVHCGGLQIQYYGCELRLAASNFPVNTPTNFRACRFTLSGNVNWRSGTDVIGTAATVVAGTGSTLWNHQSGQTTHSSITLTGARMFVTQCSVQLSGHVRNTAGPILVQGSSGYLLATSVISGANNTGIGIDVPSGTMAYSGSNKPTVTGTTSDARVGGVTRSYAQIPFIAAQLDNVPPTVATLTGNGAKFVSE